MARKKISPGIGTRRKIPIEKIDDEDARHVCFWNRRNGLFTKASDLSTLCGGEIAIVINSIADNLYSFGSPDVHKVTDRYLADDTAVGPKTVEKPFQCASALQWLNDRCMTLADALKTATERKGTLEQQQETMSRQNEMCKSVIEVHHVGLNDLEKLKKTLDELKAAAMGRINGLVHEDALPVATTSANCPRNVGVARARLAKVGTQHKFL